MIPICLYFQVHQPYRLRRYNYFDVGREHRYFDDVRNREILLEVAERCYLPATAMLERLLDRHPRFAASFSLSGTLIEQLGAWAPSTLQAFRRLAASGRVEFLAETSHHSLAWLASREEFTSQVALHRTRLREELGAEARVFRNTELIYSDALASCVEELGFQGVLADGVEPLLGTRSPAHVYRAATPKGLPLLVRHYRLSDDVAFRFSDRSWPDWPLTPATYDRWISGTRGDLVSLFMDFETFGEHQRRETGIFEFFEGWVDGRLAHRGAAFLTPTAAIERLPHGDTLSAPRLLSWADEARDVSAWQGNDLQRDALGKLFALERRLRASGSDALAEDFRRLSTSDHFYYMATKSAGDEHVHAYFSPFESPYDAYITYMHVVSDLERRLPRPARARSAPPRIRPPGAARLKTPPVLLLVCDGWGHAPPSEGNAISRARTPIYDRWLAEYPWTLLEASGEAVGLPAGVMGNSEVGHLTLGAGRMVSQDLLRIDLALRDQSFFTNPALLAAMQHARRRGATLHLMGLLSDGGVHSHQRHLEGLLELAARTAVPRVRVHAFTDGRDTPPQSALGYVSRLEAALAKWGGKIATVSGRYYAMDRDKRWDRVARAYQALVFSSGLKAATPAGAIEAAYARGETDEFIQPTVLTESGEPVGPMRDGDAVIFFNFRADRARQLTRALNEEAFADFPRPKAPRLHFLCFTAYKEDFGLPVAFPPQALTHILADVWARDGIANLRLAETEKYAHVTYFFNGGVEEPYPGEQRILVPSWKGATYDLHPEMSAAQITEEAVRALRDGRFGAHVVNFANADMVGHTGKLAETIVAVETLDRCFGILEAACKEAGVALLMTADHGNAEQMIDPSTGAPHTAHTLNPVPFILCAKKGSLGDGGALFDVAPTLLGVQALEKPAEMTGRDLRR